MKRSRDPKDRIPVGSYCYSYEISPKSPFKTHEELENYLKSLPSGARDTERFKHLRYVCCPYWKPMSHGRVRCKLIGITALIWSHERKADPLFKKHPKAEERITGFLLGDQVKECGINKETWDS